MILLFSLPTNLRKREFVLHWKEAAARVPWHILLMVTSAVGMTDALENFGFMDILANSVKEAHINSTALPYFTGLATSISTNFISGVAAASYSLIFAPIL